MLNGFVFKEFRIRHDRCAMKVGTDGVLLAMRYNSRVRMQNSRFLRNSYGFTMAICGHGSLSILSMRW